MTAFPSLRLFLRFHRAQITMEKRVGSLFSAKKQPARSKKLLPVEDYRDSTRGLCSTGSTALDSGTEHDTHLHWLAPAFTHTTIDDFLFNQIRLSR